jgi:protein O-mannosyl-transferase
MDAAAVPSLIAESSTHARRSAGRALALLGIVLAVTFLAYAGTMRFDFVSDDPAQIVYNPAVHSWRNLPHLFALHVWSTQTGSIPQYYRPIFTVWTLVCYKLFGASPAPWHLAVVFIHLLATALLFQFVRRLLGDDLLAFFAALLFGLHPLHVESVAWISGANDLMTVACWCGALLAYLRFRESERRPGLWFAVSLLMYLIACLVKEPAIMLPGVIAVLEWLLMQSSPAGQKLRRIAAILIPYGVIACAYLVMRWFVLKSLGQANVPLSPWIMPLSWPMLLWFYLRKLVWPVDLALFYNTQYVLAPTWNGFWAPLLLFAASAAAIWFAIRRLPDANAGGKLTPRAAGWLSVAWMLLPIIPVLDIVTLQPDEIAHDRYAYVASAGFVLLVALAIRQIPFGKLQAFGAPATQLVCVAAIAITMAVGTVRQSAYWANDLLLYYRAMEVTPNSATAATGLGDALLQRNYLDEGIRVHESILRSNPNYWQSHFQLGNAYYKVGRFTDSEQQLLAAARLRPNVAPILLYLAIAQMKNGHYADAEQSVRRAIEVQPTTLGGHYVLGLALEREERWQDAVAAFEQELALDPDQPKVRAELDSVRQHLR